MFVFWLICALLIAVALLIILPSLLAKSSQADVGHHAVNKAVFDRKLRELEEDLERDLIGTEQFEAAQSDLKRTLIDDLEGHRESALKGSGKLLPIVILLAVPAAAVFTYLKINNGLVSLSDDFQVRIQQQGEMPSVEQAIGSLEQKLEENPDNLDGWLMLGRSYMVSGKFNAAVHAYARANVLSTGANPDVLVAYAEAQAFAAGQQFSEDVLALFVRALQIDPGHERGLWYAGFAAYQLHDYPGSVDYWGRLLQQVPSDQEEARSALQGYLSDAKQKAGIEIASALQEAGEKAFSGGKAEATASIAVQVSISEPLQGKIAASDTLFIYARALNGPGMPLALVRMTAADLPATVTLDDSVAMIPGMTLSSMEQVEVIARVSKSGQAMMQTGDLYGSVQPVSTHGSASVSIVISGAVP